MRPIDGPTLRALKGSRAGDKIVAYAWYNGQLAYPRPLPISQWSLDWDITRQIQKFSCTIADEDGVLAPWLFEDPLGVGGSELQVQYHVGDAGIISMGWYGIDQNTPDERWRTYIITNKGAVHPDSELGNDKDLVYVSGGATIQITAYDRAQRGKRARLIAPESPPTASVTVMDEIERLMRDICPVVMDPAVVDINISRNVVHERERLDAVQALTKRLFADYRMNGDGAMEVYPIAEQAPVATLEGGPGGLLVKVDRAMSTEGLYNVFVVDGSRNNDDGTVTPIRAVATIDEGPLSMYGPFGMVPEFYSSNMIETQDQAEAYAFEMKVTQLAGLTVDLAVTALPQPHLQQGDWVVVANPIVNRVAIPLIGKIKTMSLSGKGAPGPMELVVQCSYWDVQRAISGVSRNVF
jgi:hypothetical protein